MTWMSWISLTGIYLVGLLWMHRQDSSLQTFVWGSVGQVFLTLQFAFMLNLVTTLAALEAQHLQDAMSLFGIQLEILEDVLILVPDDKGWTAMTIGIESSTIIEMSVLSGLVLHYPRLSHRRRLLSILSGVILTYGLNLLRLAVIVIIVVIWGRSAFVIAHTLVGRLLYFAGVVALYWYLLTKPTLTSVQQSVEERDQ